VQVSPHELRKILETSDSELCARDQAIKRAALLSPEALAKVDALTPDERERFDRELESHVQSRLARAIRSAAERMRANAHRATLTKHRNRLRAKAARAARKKNR
jgi:hypothetical protein